MNYKYILITGGAGFIGSNLGIKLKRDFPTVNIIALDNLKRRGSELNLPRLKKEGITFTHGDVRNKEDLEFGHDIDLLIECSAEPSVLAGINSSLDYVYNTNLLGAVNCFELARKKKSNVIFLSTSRVYPINKLNALHYKESKTRFDLEDKQPFPGVSQKGITEDFPLDTYRSIYGFTKLSAEYLLQEYIHLYGLRGVINRCGVIAGPWQMGKVDQGVTVLWMAAHYFKKNLSYNGFGGKGKQVRDILHIDDLYNLIKIQMNSMDKISGQVFNAGGGADNSVSLQELTKFCQEISGKNIVIQSKPQTQKTDIKIYISDNKKITHLLKWQPKKKVKTILVDIHKWIKKYETDLKKYYE